MHSSLCAHSLLPTGDTPVFSRQWERVCKLQLVRQATPSTEAVGGGRPVPKTSQAHGGGIPARLDLCAQRHPLFHVSLQLFGTLRNVCGLPKSLAEDVRLERKRNRLRVPCSWYAHTFPWYSDC
jgi:hypothetical protein